MSVVGRRGRRRGSRGCCFAILGLLGAILGHVGAILGHLGAILGPSWANLGPSWGQLGAILGPAWGYLGPSWAILGDLGRSYDRKGDMLKNAATPTRNAHFAGQDGAKKAPRGHLDGLKPTSEAS